MHPPRFAHRAIAAVVTVVVAAGFVPAGVIYGYDPATLQSHTTYDVYSAEYGFPNPVRNTAQQFIAAGYDLTGLGYGRTADQAITLITPRHFLLSAHVAQGDNAPTQVRFVGGDGILRTYAVASLASVPTGTFNGTTLPNQTSDLMLGTLADPIPSAHGVMPFLVASAPNLDYAGTVPPDNVFTKRPLFATGINFDYANPFANNVVSPVIGNNFFRRGPYRAQDDSNHSTVVFNYDDAHDPGTFRAVEGDSGWPSFVSVGGKLALLGLHYDVTSPASGMVAVDTFVPYYVPAIDAAIGPNYTVGLIAIPEPSSALLGLATIGLYFVRRRRWRNS